MSTPIRHHFLPQFYLKNFTDDKGFLFEFDRSTKSFSYKTPHGTGWQRNFYRYRGKDGQTHTDIETELLREIEDRTKPVIDKINKGLSLDYSDKEVLAVFVAFQHTRVPDFFKGMDEMTQAMVDKITEWEFPNEKILVKVPKEHNLKTMMMLAKEIVPIFLVLDWTLLRAPKSTAFITSDSPFFIVPPPGRNKNNFHERGVGIVTPGAQKCMPLSSSVCIVMGDNGSKIKEFNVDRKQVRRMNQNIAVFSDNYVISQHKALLERIIKDTKIDQWQKTKRIEVN